MADEKSKALDKLQQEEFCQLYVSKEFFGNGVETYLEVYDIDRSKPNWYKTACSAASRLLSNVKVAERISQLLDDAGLNDSHVDKQLLFLITQHADFIRLRLESVQNATDQARHGARTILGAQHSYTELPWFWSTQGPLPAADGRAPTAR
ncbi:hypothetical protein [Arthrobacter sp. 9MFCol3.1]|uniref:hypothetical protein n=1 Tax=Arthrobacter sp. 9MFCol3.1 TaxID=1150398 RepID=UPI000478E74C|nr:hypothetical protein [Arthrobacter sp. 9MFCol3.1]